MAYKSSTLGDLEESQSTMLCQSCGIVTKRYVVGNRRRYYQIGRWQLPINFQ